MDPDEPFGPPIKVKTSRPKRSCGRRSHGRSRGSSSDGTAPVIAATFSLLGGREGSSTSSEEECSLGLPSTQHSRRRRLLCKRALREILLKPSSLETLPRISIELFPRHPRFPPSLPPDGPEHTLTHKMPGVDAIRARLR
jgi:hypothetical protein